jgi:hypothetical protein
MITRNLCRPRATYLRAKETARRGLFEAESLVPLPFTLFLAEGRGRVA